MSVPEESSDRSFQRKRFIALTVLVLLLAAVLINSRLAGRPPIVEKIDPQIGEPGEVMVISGKFFGERNEKSEVRIAGVPIHSSDYLEWSDARIRFELPEEVRSGIIYVVTGSGRSAVSVFASRNQIPSVATGRAKRGDPFISSVDPIAGHVGTLLNVRGVNFGEQRGESEVFFSWISEGASAISLIPALDRNLDFEKWGDQEIHVRIPDGAVSGNMFIVAEKGKSNSVFLEIEGGGRKRYHQKRTYSVQFSLIVENVNAQRGNGLYLWIPKIIEAPEQKNIQLVTQDPEPLFADISDSKLFFLEELETGKSYNITHNMIFDRYAIESKITASLASSGYTKSQSIFTKYTATDYVVPSDHWRVKQVAQYIVGRSRNPYWKALLIYNYIRARLSPSAVDDASMYTKEKVVQAIDTRIGNSYAYAVLYCAVCRAVGIPSRPVAGYIIDGNRRPRNHYWAEVYFAGIGWMPVDPHLGDGSKLVSLPANIDRGKYYFGNLDNSHIVISKGVSVLQQMSLAGKSVRRNGRADFQTIHEEVVGNLTSYSISWMGMELLGIY